MNRDSLLNDSEAAQIYALDGRQARMWTAMPAIVTAVNLSQMTVQVQPAIQGTYTNEQGALSYVNLPLLVDVPICFPSAGGFSLTLPITSGDEVLVIIASRCIDAWWQLGCNSAPFTQKPIELRMHDLSDGFAIPGPRSLPNVVESISSTSAQLRSDAGTSYVGINGSGLIQLASPTKTLKGVLDGIITLLTSLESALSTFATTAQTDPVAVVTAAAAATLLTSLGTLITQANAYKTTDVGVLTE